MICSSSQQQRHRDNEFEIPPLGPPPNWHRADSPTRLGQSLAQRLLRVEQPRPNRPRPPALLLTAKRPPARLDKRKCPDVTREQECRQECRRQPAPSSRPQSPPRLDNLETWRPVKLETLTPRHHPRLPDHETNVVLQHGPLARLDNWITRKHTSHETKEARLPRSPWNDAPSIPLVCRSSTTLIPRRRQDLETLAAELPMPHGSQQPCDQGTSR